MVRKEKPSLCGRLVIKGRISDLFLDRHYRLRVNRPGSIQIARPCNTQSAQAGVARAGSRGAEKHEVVMAALDHMSRACRQGIIGAGLRAERHDSGLLDPRPGGRFASGLHGHIGKRWNEIGRGRSMRRAQVKHVPCPAVEISYPVRSRGGVHLILASKIERRPLLFPMNQVFAGGQAGEPSLGPGPVVIHIIRAPVLVNPDVARTQCIAQARPVPVFEHDTLVLSVEAQSRFRTAIGVMRRGAGRGRAGGYCQ